MHASSWLRRISSATNFEFVVRCSVRSCATGRLTHGANLLTENAKLHD